MQIREQQARDSVRLVWNVMPSNRLLQAKVAVPQALHYTPLQQRENTIIEHTPPQCKKCQAFVNPYNRIHFNKVEYTCCICKTLNSFPPNYLSKKDYPPEMSLNYSSFIRTQRIAEFAKKMGYLFVVDLCVEKVQLESIKEAIIDLVNDLENDCPVGLISFNKFATIYDLTSKMCKSHSFSPQNQLQTLDFAKNLDINITENNRNLDKYISILGVCREAFIQRVTSLKKIKHISYKHQREARATGLSLNLAISLNELAYDVNRIVFFCGGPCTVGSGKIIEQDYKQEMRGIKEPISSLAKAAKEYYSKLAKKAKSKLITIDSYLLSVQGLGLDEMNELLTSTGGLLVLHEQFNSKIFKESFKKAYQGYSEYPPLEKATYSSLNIKCSQQIVIVKENNDKKQGKQSQAMIIIGDLDQCRTISVAFQLADVNTNAEAYYMQFKTTYFYPENKSLRFERITTIRRLFGTFPGDLAQGFDQGAAVAYLAKLAVARSMEISTDQLRHWLDNMLCKWAQVLAEYRKGAMDSFRLVDCIKSFPQFIYHLRRNAIIRKSGLSLDEYVYICNTVKRQSVQNLILIIQPALLRYTAQHQQMHPVSLDQKYLKPDCILLLDSYFNVVQWRGKHIAEIIEQNLHKEGEYGYVERLLSNVEKDIESLKYDRFPVPQYYLTGAGQSKERIIKSRLSSREHEQQEGNLSDEVDVSVFTEKLIELVVNKKV